MEGVAKMSILGMMIVGALAYMVYDIGRTYAEKRAEHEGDR
tara:strand:- start:28 stop:150 length:123 start_codon:yes stop_codon:yes gene_type:complete